MILNDNFARNFNLLTNEGKYNYKRQKIIERIGSNKLGCWNIINSKNGEIFSLRFASVKFGFNFIFSRLFQ